MSSKGKFIINANTRICSKYKDTQVLEMQEFKLTCQCFGNRK